MVRLSKAGVDFNRLTDLILTHFHPDHVSGVPMLLMNMWLIYLHADRFDPANESNCERMNLIYINTTETQELDSRHSHQHDPT
jgi:metal-dependent hydrolase (beta-lactamase superfamily II)